MPLGIGKDTGRWVGWVEVGGGGCINSCECGCASGF